MYEQKRAPLFCRNHFARLMGFEPLFDIMSTSNIEALIPFAHKNINKIGHTFSVFNEPLPCAFYFAHDIAFVFTFFQRLAFVVCLFTAHYRNFNFDLTLFIIHHKRHYCQAL